MDLKNYKSGIYNGQYGYQSFLPELINRDWILSDSKVSKLLSQADRKIGELNAFPDLIPDVDFFIRMHITKEATQSSRIEGTQTSIEEAVQEEGFIDPDKKDDWREVHNYIQAMNYAISQLRKLPLSSRLLKLTHKRLLQGVRGKYKMPGDYRTSQNWIGGASLKDAVFVPPHHSTVGQFMSDLEHFINNEKLDIPPLIRIAMIHYQFETIHPFLDGNGRLGRLLITLYLVENKVISRPVLYLSDYFERNRMLYYDRLTLVRTKNQMLQWVAFFLTGILETAENSINTFHAIIRLRQQIEQKKIVKLGKRAPLALDLMQQLYGKPIMTAIEVAETLGVNPSTAHRLLQEMLKLNILKERTGFKRNRIFIFEDYLKLFR